MRHALRSLLLAALIGHAPCAEPAPGPRPAAPGQEPTSLTAHLRGLGELRAERHPDAERDGGSWFTITASDARHARWCASKYLADATAIGPVRQVEDAGLPGTVLALDQAGWWLLGVDDRRFQILHARTREALRAQATLARAAAWAPVTAGTHPAWLDCFDNASVGFWVLGGGELPQDLEADLRWFKDRRFTMCVTGVDETRLVAPGVLDTTLLDWYAAKARQHGVPYRMLLGWAGATRPAWVRNVVPLPHIPLADGPAANGPAFDRMNEGEVAYEPVAATDPWVLDARRRIAARAAEDPWFIGHHASPELSSVSTQGLDRVAALPETQRAWAAYLRDVLRLDLRSASLRHTGRADAYATWDAVPVPLTRDFSGWDPATGIDLRGTWEGHADRERAGEAAGWFDERRAPVGWVPVDCNDAMLLLYARGWDPDRNPSYWLRRTIDLPAAHLDAPRFLHISRSWWHGPRTRMKAWVNGKALQELTRHDPVAPDSDLCFAIGDALVAGANRIVLDTRGTPVPSYIFISPTGRAAFPGRGAALDQRFFDATNFVPHLRGAGLENAMAATRAGDPDRPMKVMAPLEHSDVIAPLFARYGAYPHDTGQTAACWAPWTTSAIRARGGQHSSEPGGPANTPDDLRDFFAYYLMLGDDAVDIVFHNARYRTRPELAAWIDAHRQLMACVGKMERMRPAVAVLRSNRTTRLGIDTPYNHDVTRGELQACGRTGQVIDLPDVAAGFADAHPVIIDALTEVMTDGDVSALEGYVRRGGTFIALHHTGRHAPERANAWPIARLTGLRVKDDGAIGGKPLVIGEQQTLFPAARGRRLDGWGMMLEPLPGVAAGAADGAVEAIATWQDGLGIAVGRRRLGKGQVITLGSVFWRDGRAIDRAFVPGPAKAAFLDQLLTAVGAARQSATASPDVWAEPWQSKNGLFDLYPVACMSTDAKAAAIGDVTLARGAAPAAVWEVSTAGSPTVPATWRDGRLVLAGIASTPMVPRVFAAPRTDLRLAPLHWLDVQRRQWGALPAAKRIAAPASVPAAEVVPLIDGWRATAAEPAAGWTGAPGPSAGWAQARLGTLAAMGHAEDAQLRCFRRVAVPAAWQGQRIRLVFDAPAWFWGINPRARLWAGGRPVAVRGFGPMDAADPVLRSRHHASFSVDVTDRVRDGTLDLALELDGRIAPGEHRPRPAGITGVFYLQATPMPLAEQALTAWSAATDVNVLAPTQVGQRTRFAYLEARFTLPEAWPGTRLFLTAPDEDLHVLVINNTVIMVPPSQHRLDISRLARRDGENVVRWLPGGSIHGWPAFPSADTIAERAVPGLSLAWWP